MSNWLKYSIVFTVYISGYYESYLLGKEEMTRFESTLNKEYDWCKPCQQTVWSKKDRNEELVISLGSWLSFSGTGLVYLMNTPSDNENKKANW